MAKHIELKPIMEDKNKIVIPQKKTTLTEHHIFWTVSLVLNNIVERIYLTKNKEDADKQFNELCAEFSYNWKESNINWALDAGYWAIDNGSINITKPIYLNG